MGQLDDAATVDTGRALIEEILRTAFALHDVLASLLDDLPENAFPGEDSGKVLIEMVVGTCLPAVTAVGVAECQTATALIGAVRDRVIDDLRRAAELAQRNC